MRDQSVTVVVKGTGLIRDEGSLSGLRVIERDFEFEDPLEFGKFLGPKYVSSTVSARDSSLVIPREARYTWNIVRVKGASKELYREWAKEFHTSDIGKESLSRKEILLYWLQRTGDETIIELIL